jgi:hypothetical protein
MLRLIRWFSRLSRGLIIVVGKMFWPPVDPYDWCRVRMNSTPEPGAGRQPELTIEKFNNINNTSDKFVTIFDICPLHKRREGGPR